jgi:hypothetical protein
MTKRTIPKKYYRKFAAHWKDRVRVGEARFWEPHWTRDVPLSVRLLRLGLDIDLVQWILWWIRAFDKLKRGEPIDRSSEPPTPKCIRHSGQSRDKNMRIFAIGLRITRVRSFGTFG